MSPGAPDGAAARPARPVVHVVASYPPALGGMEQVVQSLARRQCELGLPVSVVTADQPRGASAPSEPFPVLRLRTFTVAHTAIIPGLAAALTHTAPDSLLHLHISTAYVPEVVWLVARRSGRPYVAHVHIDVLASGRAGFLLGPYKRMLLGPALRGAAAVVVPTPDYRTIIGEKYGVPPERITVIPNGTDHRIAPRPRTPPDTGRALRLLFVGRLSVQKNLPLLLDSVATFLRRTERQVTLRLVGDGPERATTAAAVERLGLGDVVTLLGTLRGRALEAEYEEADALLLTSTNESFGLVLVEAMTKGLPIVTVDIPAVRNIVADGVNGLLAASDPEAVAKALRRLSSDASLYAAISRANLAEARRFSWSATADAVSAVYVGI